MTPQGDSYYTVHFMLPGGDISWRCDQPGEAWAQKAVDEAVAIIREHESNAEGVTSQ